MRINVPVYLGDNTKPIKRFTAPDSTMLSGVECEDKDIIMTPTLGKTPLINVCGSEVRRGDTTGFNFTYDIDSVNPWRWHSSDFTNCGAPWTSDLYSFNLNSFGNFFSNPNPLTANNFTFIFGFMNNCIESGMFRFFRTVDNNNTIQISLNNINASYSARMSIIVKGDTTFSETLDLPNIIRFYTAYLIFSGNSLKIKFKYGTGATDYLSYNYSIPNVSLNAGNFNIGGLYYSFYTESLSETEALNAIDNLYNMVSNSKYRELVWGQCKVLGISSDGSTYNIIGKEDPAHNYVIGQNKKFYADNPSYKGYLIMCPFNMVGGYGLSADVETNGAICYANYMKIKSGGQWENGEAYGYTGIPDFLIHNYFNNSTILYEIDSDDGGQGYETGTYSILNQISSSGTYTIRASEYATWPKYIYTFYVPYGANVKLTRI